MKNLLASHGSRGGIAAENAAIDYSNQGDDLDHLYVVPLWWSHMTGDDWLNNGITRNRYRDYLQNELTQESEEVINRVRQECKQKKINYNALITIGDSDESLYLQSNKHTYGKIFIGSRRPKHVEGLQDIMLTRKIIKKIGVKLEVIDYPHG